MTRHDQKIIFMALAIIAVLLEERQNLNENSVGKIKSYANLIEQFCDEHVVPDMSEVLS